jgi:hypothetical protein
MVEGGCFSNRETFKTSDVDEEPLITGVSVSEENQKVLNGGVSASEENQKVKVVFQHRKKIKKC